MLIRYLLDLLLITCSYQPSDLSRHWKKSWYLPSSSYLRCYASFFRLYSTLWVRWLYKNIYSLVEAKILLLVKVLLGCHSERILHIFGKLDYSGIALLTMGSFVPWVYYTFYCETQSKIVYMGMRILNSCIRGNNYLSNDIYIGCYFCDSESMGQIRTSRVSCNSGWCIFISWPIRCYTYDSCVN